MTIQPTKHRSGRAAVSARVRSGFTLIELLVVVAIIVVLISVLLPALGESKRKAMTTVCESNLRQLATASILYSNSNDNLMIPYLTQLYTNSDQQSWCFYYTAATSTYSFTGSFVDPYSSGQPKVAICPEMTNGVYASAYSITNSAGQLQCNYGIAAIGGGYAKTISQIMTPSETVAFADTATASSGGQLTTALSVARPSGDDFTAGTLHGRHVNNLANVSFLDAHVEAIAPQLRPAGTLTLGSKYAINLPFNIGSLCYGKIDPTQFSSSSSSFDAYARAKLDYYFWKSKGDQN